MKRTLTKLYEFESHWRNCNKDDGYLLFLKLIVSDKGVEDLRILLEVPNYVEHKLKSFNLYSCFLTLSIPFNLALNGKLSLPKSRRCLAICSKMSHFYG